MLKVFRINEKTGKIYLGKIRKDTKNMSVKISASAGYLPKRIVTNDELASIMETSDEWIRSHTGIKTRHFAIGENTSDMAAKVAVSLMEKAEVSPEEIDLIIVSTISPDSITPSTAALVQGKTGCVNAFAYDISAACAGFVFALSTAEKFIRCGQYEKAIVISAETNSKMMDFKDRTSAVFLATEQPESCWNQAKTLKMKASSQKNCMQKETGKSSTADASNRFRQFLLKITQRWMLFTKTAVPFIIL